MTGILLALRFALELCLLASAAVIGLATSEQAVVRILAAVALTAAVGILWGSLLAPRRRVDLALAARVAIELALFVAAGVGLALAGHRTAGVALVAAELVVLVALIRLGHPPGSDPERRATP